MALPQGSRTKGQRHVESVLNNNASTFSAGDLVQDVEATGTNSVDVPASNVAVAGFIVDKTILTAATGLLDRIYPGDQFWVKVKTGTLTAASIGKFADLILNSGVNWGITLTNVNNDVRIISWDGVTTNYCVVEFIKSSAVSNA